VKKFARKTLPLCLVGLLLSACATSNTIPEVNAGNPTARSVYFYVVGSYFQNFGKNADADMFYRLSAQEDIQSQGIQRQILVNSFDLFQDDGISAEDLEKLIVEYTTQYEPDEKLLYRILQFQEYVWDTENARQSISELRSRFPSARADLSLFFHILRNTGETDLSLLKSADKKAKNDVEQILLLANIWSFYDSSKEKALLLRAHELNPNDESHFRLADFAVRNADLKLARQYFSDLSYPEDRELMLFLTDSEFVMERNPILLDLADDILATEAPELLYSLTFAALVGKRPDILNRIGKLAPTLIATEDELQPIWSMLLAGSILNQEKQPLDEMIAKLYETGSYNSLVTYYAYGVDTNISDSLVLEDPQAWPDFISQVRQRMKDTPASRYLQTLAAAIIDEGKTDFSEARFNLILWLRENRVPSEEDYAYLLAWYQFHSRKEIYDATLREALDVYPDNPGFCNDLGYRMLTNNEDLEEAARLIRHALVFEPENIFYLDSLAWYHFLVGEASKALEMMALPMLEPELPAEIIWHIGEIHRALGLHREARKWLERIILQNDDPDFVEQARSSLLGLP